MGSMKSHSYEFDMRWLLGLLGPVLLLIVASACCLRLAPLFLPQARDAWDMDRAIMATQTDLAATQSNADIVLIGDSSCLMNLDAALISSLSGKKVVNLGTVSFLNMEVFGTLLKRYMESQEHPPSKVILMTHPDFLRRASASRMHVEWIEHYMKGLDYWSGSTSWKSVGRYMGVHLIQGRLLSWLPRPLKAEFGSLFGFTKDLERYMKQHHGSALDPRSLQSEDLKGSREYRISTANMRHAESFKSILPVDTDLLVALSPLPEGFVDASLQSELPELRSQWSASLKADTIIQMLPLTMPDADFASKTHLTPKANQTYSKRLALFLKGL